MIEWDRQEGVWERGEDKQQRTSRNQTPGSGTAGAWAVPALPGEPPRPPRITQFLFIGFIFLVTVPIRQKQTVAPWWAPEGPSPTRGFISAVLDAEPGRERALIHVSRLHANDLLLTGSVTHPPASPPLQAPPGTNVSSRGWSPDQWVGRLSLHTAAEDKQTYMMREI